MAAHNGRLADGKGIEETRFGTVTEVDHHAQSVHFAYHLLAKSTHTAMRLRASCTVANRVVAVVTQRDINDSALRKVGNVANIVFNSQPVFNAEHNAFLAHRLVFVELLGCSGQGNIVTLVRHDGLYLVENAIGIPARRHAFGQFSGLRMLRKIGHHGHGVLLSVGHLVQIVEHLEVSLLKMHALWEEHRRVTMAVKREDFAVKCLGSLELPAALREPFKQFQSLVAHPFGMPLHAHERLLLGAFHRFNHTIGCRGYDMEMRTAVFHRLMVKTIDKSFLSIKAI